MNRIDVKMIAINAMIAGIYAVLTMAIAPLSYGAIQMRISEVMVFLAFYNKKYIPGLVLGCLIANTISPLGMMDMCFGTLSTLIVCLAMYKLKNLFVAGIVGGVITGLIIGVELYVALDLPFMINAFYVFAGEVIILVIGAIVFKLIEKNETLMKKYVLE
ncbi:MAG: QueT transporter family protein [Coprobacillus sp.]